MNKFVCVILCGGQSLRMRFEFPYTNKVLVPIAGKPMLHQILDIYSGVNLFKHFVLCLGNDYESIESSLLNAKNFANNTWNNIPITILNTGIKNTATSRIVQALDSFTDESFFLSYADIFSDINFQSFIDFHFNNNASFTMALSRARMPYGKVISNETGVIEKFEEKPILDDWINAGYFVAKRSVFYLADTNKEFESEFLPSLISKNQKLLAFKHYGFWQGIDNYKDFVSFNQTFETYKIKLLVN